MNMNYMFFFGCIILVKNLYIKKLYSIIKNMEKRFCYENITGVHLELTTKCNAMCPMCNRNFKGKVRENLPILELGLDDIKTILSDSFIKQLKLVSLCGVYGEPICAKDLKPIIKYLYKCNEDIDIDLYTNGGLYDVLWWKDLANIMKGYKGTVIFGIDGLGDIHSLHRCNTNYDKVIENAAAFIDAGGIAQWDYIVFKHNEHQVMDAWNLSKEMGFNSFQIKKTSRFLKNLYEFDEKLDSTILEYGKHPVYDNMGEVKYFIELPENKEYRNNSEIDMFKLIDKYGSVNNYLNQNEIECDAIKSGGIFISAGGEVFPCCTVYQQVCYKTIHGVKDSNELNEYNLYLDDDLSGYNRDIRSIVSGDFFRELNDSFLLESIDCGKPKSCARACGKDLDVHANGHTTKIKYRRK